LSLLAEKSNTRQYGNGGNPTLKREVFAPAAAGSVRRSLCQDIKRKRASRGRSIVMGNKDVEFPTSLETVIRAPAIESITVDKRRSLAARAQSHRCGRRIARINQKLGGRVGFINPQLYTLRPSSRAFNDITKGDNKCANKRGSNIGYEAGPGWDACSGLGSPNGEVLASLLKPARRADTRLGRSRA
jgi:hypothetical protein